MYPAFSALTLIHKAKFQPNSERIPYTLYLHLKLSHYKIRQSRPDLKAALYIYKLGVGKCIIRPKDRIRNFLPLL